MTFVILDGGIWALKVDWWATPEAWRADYALLEAEPDRYERLRDAIRTAMDQGCPPHAGGHPAGVYWCEKCQPHPRKPDNPHLQPQQPPSRVKPEPAKARSRTHKRKTPG